MKLNETEATPLCQSIPIDPKEYERVTARKIVDSYNAICTSFARVTKVSESRIKAVRARLHSGYTIDDFVRLFKKAETSRFLKGGNNKNWTATFDWLICDSNMAKTLDGNYDDKGGDANAENRENLSKNSNPNISDPNRYAGEKPDDIPF
jgi:hypothetical protein